MNNLPTPTVTHWLKLTVFPCVTEEEQQTMLAFIRNMLNGVIITRRVDYYESNVVVPHFVQLQWHLVEGTDLLEYCTDCGGLDDYAVWKHTEYVIEEIKNILGRSKGFTYTIRIVKDPMEEECNV